VQTDVFIKEECILKNKNKLCPHKFSVFYNTSLKTFGSHLVYSKKIFVSVFVGMIKMCLKENGDSMNIKSKR
jgi:hypothetical protein